MVVIYHRNTPLPKVRKGLDRYKKLLSGGDIKVTKGACQVPKWRAFVASQVVLLGETWWPESNTLVWVLQQRGLGVA
jgi:hypothetical protein